MYLLNSLTFFLTFLYDSLLNRESNKPQRKKFDAFYIKLLIPDN